MTFKPSHRTRSHVKSSVVNEEEPTAATALTRKIDLHLLPIVTLLFLLSFLDRANIGNASVEGLATKINLVDGEYNTGLASYFIGYILFEIPANVALKRTSPKIWLPTLTLGCGIVSLCQALVHNKNGFYAVRFFLGVAETGLFPGVTYVFSIYYTRKQRPIRIGLFFTGAALAGAFGGVLAYALGRIHGGGKPGWAWIFIVEGLLTIVVSLAGYWFVPTWPHQAAFLTAREREALLERLRDDADAGDLEPFQWLGVWQALRDPLAYMYALLFHSTAFTLYSISLFLPTIIKSVGFVTWKAQLLTTPPYAVASIVMLGTVWVSTRAQRKAPFIICACAVAIIGYIILITTSSAGPQYVGTFVVVSGVYTATGMVLSWPTENVSAQTKRAVAIAMQISLGDLGAITGVLVYRPALSAHNYRTPHIIALCYTLLAAAAAGALWAMMYKENRRRDAVADEKRTATAAASSDGWAEGWKQGDAEVARRREMGDRHPAWRYQL